MHYVEEIQRGIDYIEQRLDEPIDLRSVSREAGISHAHFQRIFKAVTGETLKAYVRSRRLAGALELLSGTEMRILDVAITSGFESQESFARAFKRLFGLTPTEYRAIGTRNLFPRKLRFDEAYLAHLEGSMTLEPVIEERSAMHVVGLRTGFSGPGAEKNTIGADLPGLWADFLQLVPTVPQLTPVPLYGVIAPAPDDDEELVYLAAGEVGADRSSPSPPLVTHSVPGGLYAVFEHRGPAHLVDKTVDYIYGTWLMRSGHRHTCGPDLEIYDDDWQGDSEDSIMRYAIPVSPMPNQRLGGPHQ